MVFDRGFSSFSLLLITDLFIEITNEQSNKRAASPHDKGQSLEYLIRGELVRACPTLPKNDGKRKRSLHSIESISLESFRILHYLSKS